MRYYDRQFGLHGRSGNVALLRVKVVLARAALFAVVDAEDRRAVRRALFLMSELDIMLFSPPGNVERKEKGLEGFNCFQMSIVFVSSSKAELSP